MMLSNMNKTPNSYLAQAHTRILNLKVPPSQPKTNRASVFNQENLSPFQRNTATIQLVKD